VKLYHPGPHKLVALRPPRFVVAQTGHSASGYTARVFTDAGIRTGHEDWFRPFRRRMRDLDGDSSWCAIPYLGRYQGVVFHQVREPLATLRSLAATAAAPPTGPKPRYRRLSAKALGLQAADPVVHAMRRFVIFNSIAEQHAVLPWRVEDLDVLTIQQVGEIVGVRVDPGRAAEALDATSRSVNKHDVPDDFGWDELPRGPLLDHGLSMTQRYGYDSR
jgi:hypothetical protein